MGPLSPRVGQSSRPNSHGGKGEPTGMEMQPVETGKSPTARMAGILDASSEIAYLYLTFERPLPSANTISKTPSVPGDSPPRPPNLKPYINPVLLPRHRKNIVLLLSCIATFLTAYASGSYSPPIPLMRADLGAPSDLSVRGGISTFCLGFALAPMVLAPFSEINGRYPVFVASGVVYVVFQAVCGVVTSLAGMLVARLLVGVGGSVFSTMVGGVIADLWDKEDRNTPMAIFSGAVLAGTGAGPLVASVMTQRLAGIGGHGVAAAWRWVFWHQVIMSAALVVALVFLFKESRGSVVLSRKARVLNKWYAELEAAGYYGVWIEEGIGSAQQGDSEGAAPELANTLARGLDEEEGREKDQEKDSSPPDSRPGSSVANTRLVRIRWLVKEDEERSSLGKMITISVYRPFHLLFTEPVVFFFSLWVAFAWAVLYLTFGSIPLVFSRQYGWDTEESGWIFAALIVGSILATIVGVWQERILHHPEWQAEPTGSARPSKFWAFMRRHFPVDAPESRLYFTCITAALLPAGLFMFGFTARRGTHWAVPAVAIVLATVGIYSVYLAVFNYFADTYHRYASSAMAAQSFCRNMLGGAFPLVTVALFTNLGEARAGALLGGVATALTAVPWVLIFFGERIRARSPFASELEKP